jgi:hypothetical protein
MVTGRVGDGVLRDRCRIDIGKPEGEFAEVAQLILGRVVERGEERATLLAAGVAINEAM